VETVKPCYAEHFENHLNFAREIMKLNLLIYARSWAPAVGGVESITESLIRLIRNADIVHLSGPALLPLALCWLLKKRTVLEHHNFQSVCPNGLLIYQPDLTVCPSHFLARHYYECYNCNSQSLGRARSLYKLLLGFPRHWLSEKVTANVAPSHRTEMRLALRRTQVIYHGIAPAGLAKESLGQRTAGPVCFAFIGRLVKEKGVSILLQSAHDLASEGYEFRLKIVGDGPERITLEAMADNLGLKNRTLFTGAVPRASISSVLDEAIAVVIPSTWEEVAGLVALEQMMLGRLVISADVGGLGEMVNGFGLKFPPGDTAALKQCMRQTLENPSLSIEMGKRARVNAVRNFSEERMMAEHVQLYEGVMHSKSHLSS
jgi:glycogen(starch) synthase